MTVPTYRFPTAVGPTWVQSNALGLVPAGRQVVFFGTNTNLGVGSTADLKPEGDTLQYLDSAERMSLVSTSASDAPLSTGTSVVYIEGLDNEYHAISETVVLNGLTPVLTTKTYTRVNRMAAVAGGSAGTNVGKITATAEVALTLQNAIPVGKGLSAQPNYTVPANAKAMLYFSYVSTGKNDESTIVLQTKPAGVPGAQWTSGITLYVHEGVQSETDIGVVLGSMVDTRVRLTALTNLPKVSITLGFIEQGSSIN